MSYKEAWFVFYYLDWQELCACTVRGYNAGELEETKKLLAYERGIDPSDINIKVENRYHTQED